MQADIGTLKEDAHEDKFIPRVGVDAKIPVVILPKTSKKRGSGTCQGIEPHLGIQGSMHVHQCWEDKRPGCPPTDDEDGQCRRGRGLMYANMDSLTQGKRADVGATGKEYSEGDNTSVNFDVPSNETACQIEPTLA